MTKRILIAEDETHIAEALRYILEREGYFVDLVTDGTHVTAQAEQIRPEVLILDVMLPGLSGFEVLKAIRSKPELENLAVIMLTAKGQPQDRQTALSLGANIFMTKPFSNREVVESVRQLILV